MRGSFVAGRAECGTCPPLLASLRRCPPNSTSFVGGRPRDDFGVEVRFWVPSCNSLPISERQDAKRQRGVGARGEPPNLGVATQRSKERGACSAFCITCNEAPQSKANCKIRRPLTRRKKAHPFRRLCSSKGVVRLSRRRLFPPIRGARGDNIAHGHLLC